MTICAKKKKKNRISGYNIENYNQINRKKMQENILEIGKQSLM